MILQKWDVDIAFLKGSKMLPRCFFAKRFLVGVLFALDICVGGQRICTAEDGAVGQSRPRYYLELNGQRFYRAFTSEKEDQLLKEYIPAGETLEHWNQLMAVHVFLKFPKEIGVDGYLQKMDESIKAKDPANRCEVYKDEKTGQGLLDFLMWAEKPELVAEWNLMLVKYVDDEGLIVYQYAKRHYLSDPHEAQAKELGMEIRKLRETMPPLVVKTDFAEKEEQADETPSAAK